ncbi:MAG: response regulator, partial [Chloroflexota bacterium]
TYIGAITLKVSRAEPDQAQNAPGELRLRFAVQDTGIGIAEDDQQAVFEPFVQLEEGERQQRGTGLGLSISRQHVELLGGQLSVESTPGIGSTFGFEIPVRPGNVDELFTSVERYSMLAPGQTAPDGQPFRLLVAEDIDANRRFLVQLLQMLGFTVRASADGQQALEAWETWQPHLIFLDLRMPGLDGFEVARRIKASAQGANTRIVILTAHVFDEDSAAVLELGCDDFIRKPVRQSQIMHVLQEQLGVQFINTGAPQATRDALDYTDESAGPLPALPESWKERMRRAVAEADVTVMQDLIDEIETYSPRLAQMLARMVYHFEYDNICSLIDRLPDPAQPA